MILDYMIYFKKDKRIILLSFYFTQTGGYKMKQVQPIRDKQQLQDMKDYLKKNYDYKYYVMFNLGIYSALRVGDILQLRVRDVRNASGKIRDEVSIKAEKTDKMHDFPINAELKRILKEYCQDKSDYEFLIPNNSTHKGIGRVQAWKILNEAASALGIEHIGTHSMRKTYGYHFYQQTKDISLLQEILGHSDPSITKRYIGLTRETKMDAMKKFKY